VADRERRQAVGQGRPRLPSVGGAEDAARRAAHVEVAVAGGEAGDPPGHQPRAAAGVRGEGIAVARVVGVVGPAGDLGPRAAVDRRPLSDANAALYAPGKTMPGPVRACAYCSAAIRDSTRSSPASPTLARRPWRERGDSFSTDPGRSGGVAPGAR